MTKPATESKSLFTRFSEAKLPQALLVLGAVALGIACIYAPPAEERGTIAVYVLGLVFAVVTGTAMPSFLRGKAQAPTVADDDEDDGDDEPGPPPAPPPPARPRRMSGHATTEVLGGVLILWSLAAGLWHLASRWIPGLGLALLLVTTASSCGASAMQAHVRGARIAIEVLDAARGVSNATQDQLQGECPDEACILEVDARFVPISVALDSTHAAWVLWVSAIEIGHLGGTTDGLLVAAVSAASRLLSEYSNLLRALATVGIEGPRMPEIVGLDGSAR